jgi:hypothetical protein
MKKVPASFASPFLLSSVSLLLFAGLLFVSSCKSDPCEEVACQNGGACIEGVCECLPGFVGDSCQFFDPSQYFGTYRAEYTNCFVTSDNHRVIIEEVPGEGGKIAIFDLGDYDCPGGDLQIEGIITGNQLNIPDQTVDCGVISYQFSGDGVLTDGTVLTIDFRVAYDAGGFEQVDDCQVRMAK